ncbi:MAG: hypothetical protein VKO21_03765 [Candidatus Sericytochromatia bacterium]|nr:hypothetical protein [Candidatus Sericytochromatia bacterium]
MVFLPWTVAGLVVALAFGAPPLVEGRLREGLAAGVADVGLKVGKVAWTPRAATHDTWGVVGDMEGDFLMPATTSVPPLAWELRGIRLDMASIFREPALAQPARLRFQIRLRDAEVLPFLRAEASSMLKQLPAALPMSPDIRIKDFTLAEGRVQLQISATIPLAPVALPVQIGLTPVLSPEGRLGLENVSVRMMGQELARNLPLPKLVDVASLLPAEISEPRVEEFVIADGWLKLTATALVRDLPRSP